MFISRHFICLTLLLSLLAPASASAHSSLRADVEVDPIAYLADGYSLHVGAGWERVRADFGAFALTLPELAHGNDGFQVSMHGFGVKLDLFYDPLQLRGPFVGVEAGWLRTHIARTDDPRTQERARRLSMGVRAGWRFALPARFFISPWLGIDYSPGIATRQLGEHHYEESPWSLFPTVHLGYRF